MLILRSLALFGSNSAERDSGCQATSSHHPSVQMSRSGHIWLGIYSLRFIPVLHAQWSPRTMTAAIVDDSRFKHDIHNIVTLQLNPARRNHHCPPSPKQLSIGTWYTPLGWSSGIRNTSGGNFVFPGDHRTSHSPPLYRESPKLVPNLVLRTHF